MIGMIDKVYDRDQRMIDAKTTVYDDSHYTQMILLHLVFTLSHEVHTRPLVNTVLTLRFVFSPEKTKMSSHFSVLPLSLSLRGPFFSIEIQ
jgi:hypothetical protein